MLKSVILKLGGEYLSGDVCRADYAKAEKIALDIIGAKNGGVSVGVVIGGGNFWRGRDVPYGFNRAKADQMGMLASVMNGVFLSEVFRETGCPARVLTPFPAGGFAELYSTDAARAYLEGGVVPIFAGGTGQSFFSTDTIAVIRGAELNVSRVLFAKEAPGVCSADPKHASADSLIVYEEITASEIIKNNLTVVDIAAMVVARENKVPCALFDIRREGAVKAACLGEQTGTNIICE